MKNRVGEVGGIRGFRFGLRGSKAVWGLRFGAYVMGFLGLEGGGRQDTKLE